MIGLVNFGLGASVLLFVVVSLFARNDRESSGTINGLTTTQSKEGGSNAFGLGSGLGIRFVLVMIMRFVLVFIALSVFLVDYYYYYDGFSCGEMNGVSICYVFSLLSFLLFVSLVSPAIRKLDITVIGVLLIVLLLFLSLRELSFNVEMSYGSSLEPLSVLLVLLVVTFFVSSVYVAVRRIETLVDKLLLYLGSKTVMTVLSIGIIYFSTK